MFEESEEWKLGPRRRKKRRKKRKRRRTVSRGVEWEGGSEGGRK